MFVKRNEVRKRGGKSKKRGGGGGQRENGDQKRKKQATHKSLQNQPRIESLTAKLTIKTQPTAALSKTIYLSNRS